MPADRIHLVRHGEVDNPERILYGRLPGYGLSELGQAMAAAAAESLDRSVAALVASPLLRTQQSAAPWTARFGLEPELDERVIEPTNAFEGGRMSASRIVRTPVLWPKLINPLRPSWGEPYTSVRDRMLAAMAAHGAAVDGGDLVIVTHQMPIETVTRAITGRSLAHNPAARRCTLSSITSFAFDPRASTGFAELDYQEPAAHLLAESTDLGAV